MEMWMSVIRNVLLAIGVLIAQKGWMSEAEWTQVVGFVLIAVSLVWKLVQRRKTLALLRGYEARLGMNLNHNPNKF